MSPPNKSTSSDDSPVTQREFERLLEDHKQDMCDIKTALSNLSNKIDKINEEKIPMIQQKEAILSSSTKIYISLAIAAASFVSAILLGIVRAFVGI